LFTYDPAQPLDPDHWAKQESKRFILGTLLFCLEAMPIPPRFSQAGKREAELGPTFRVKDFCVVVSLENSRPLVINMTASAYEQRYLEVLLLEKARKAILDEKEFAYVAAEPSQPPKEIAIKSLEQLTGVYAQGGSRRSLAVDAGGPAEPAVALLNALGVRFSQPPGKTVLDIGLICHMLFASDTGHDDKNKMLIKTCFTPLSLAERAHGLNPADSQAVIEKNLELSSPESTTSAVLKPAAIIPSEIAQASPEQIKDEALAHGSVGNDNKSYKSLADAISGISGPPGQVSFDDTKSSAGQTDTANDTANYAVAEHQGIGSDFEKLGLSHLPAEINLTDIASQVESGSRSRILPSAATRTLVDAASPVNLEVIEAAAQTKEEPVDQASESKTEPLMVKESDLQQQAPEDNHPANSMLTDQKDGSENAEISIQGSDQLPVPTRQEPVRRASGSQEPKLVMNEMASLISKLEQQVSKASKRLGSRVEDTEQRLELLLESVIEEVSQEDRDIEASMLVLCANLGKEFEHRLEELRQEINHSAGDGRQEIRNLLSLSNLEVDSRKTSIQEELESACREFRGTTEELIQESKEVLQKLLNKSLQEMEEVLKTTLERLNSSTDEQVEKLNERFDRFRERMTEEASAVLITVERNVRSMGEEIDGSWQRASEKLRSTQSDFEQTILHAVRVAELTLSGTARTLLAEQFVPKLRERKEIVATMIAEMTKTFSENSANKTRSQIMGLGASLTSARQQLQVLSDECLTKIETIGRGQQNVLEEQFRDTAAYVEASTTNVLNRLHKAEEQILESEAVCKKVAETFSLDADPALTEERNQAFSAVHSKRSQMKKDLETLAEQSCSRLEEAAQRAQLLANNRRTEQTQALREASEKGLNRIREAIQEAFTAIQVSRESHME
jgi:hypothetical protein